MFHREGRDISKELNSTRRDCTRGGKGKTGSIPAHAQVGTYPFHKNDLKHESQERQQHTSPRMGRVLRVPFGADGCVSPLLA